MVGPGLKRRNPTLDPATPPEGRIVPGRARLIPQGNQQSFSELLLGVQVVCKDDHPGSLPSLWAQVCSKGRSVFPLRWNQGWPVSFYNQYNVAVMCEFGNLVLKWPGNFYVHFLRIQLPRKKAQTRSLNDSQRNKSRDSNITWNHEQATPTQPRWNCSTMNKYLGAVLSYGLLGWFVAQ